MREKAPSEGYSKRRELEWATNRSVQLTIDLGRWVLEGKPARLSIDRFQKYFSAGSGTEIDNEEMECVLANMIYKVCGRTLRT